MDGVRLTIAVVGFLRTLVGNRDALEDRFAAGGDGLQVLLFESAREIFERFLAGLQGHLVTVGLAADIRQVQGLIQKTTAVWLCEPVVKGDRRCIRRMGGDPLLEQVLGDAQLAVIQVAELWRLFLAPLPDAQQIAASLAGGGLLQSVFAGLERHLRRPQTLFELRQIYRPPELKA